MLRPQGEVAPTEGELVGLCQPLAAELAGEELGVLDDRRFEPPVTVPSNQRGQFIFEPPQRLPIVG